MDLIPTYVADDARYDGRMTYSRSGRSGLMLPQVSLGFWHNFGNTGNFDTMRSIARTAFDAGITQFDAANNYGPEYGAAEANLGRLLANDFKAYRDELVVTSKAGFDMWPGPYGDLGSRKYLIASCDASLKRLGLEYVDIFYHHRPDPDTPLEETMLALDQIVRSGKALYVGISNYSAAQTLEAATILHELKTPFVINQVRYSIFDRTIETEGLKEAARKAGIGLIAYSPLAQGMLTDRYLNGIPQDSRIARDHRFLKESDLSPARLEQIRELTKIAQARGQSLAEMSLAWILRDGAFTSVLIGASRPDQVLDNVGALQNTSFTAEEVAAIDRIAPAE